MNFINKIKIRSKLLMVLALSALALIAAIGISTSMMHAKMVEDRIAKLRGIVELSYGLAEQLEQQVQAGKLTHDQALDRFKDDTAAMWYDDHHSYIAIGNLDGTWWMNPAAPKVNGTRGTLMPNGKYILDGLIDAVSSSDEGMFAYD